MAGLYDITIEQGATWTLNLTYKDENQDRVNLTGYAAALQIRQFAKSADILLSRSTVAGNIVLGGATGTITVTATATETAALNAGVAVYDLELLSPLGITTRLIQGSVTISAEVTR